MNERRTFSRVPFVADAMLVFAGGQLPAELLDLSLAGALVACADAAAPGRGETVTLVLALGDNALVLEMGARVAHREGDHFGLAFERVELETMVHLRRLLELNLGDAERIKREVFELIRPATD